MRLASILRLRIRSLFSRADIEQELNEELRYHLDRQIEEELAGGKPLEEAHFAALRSIRDIEQRKEDCRDMQKIQWLEDVAGDLRYAARQLLKHKSFAAVAIMTLALGIGASTAILA